ncbi:MAG: alginate export family protein [Betaproteobacteria bacterium]|nr:alginate export family protein [Betaproteobacteria bacterium]
MKNSSRVWLPGAIASILAVGGVHAAPPAAGKLAKAGDAQAEILRRLQDLEAQVAQFKAETARLQAELDGRTPAENRPARDGSRVAQASKGGADDWGDPEVARKPEGRDEEARRRLLALETQARKNTAEAVKREEERKDKVQFDFSGKYKAQINSRHNFNLGNPLQEWKFDNASFVDHRFSLQIDATYEAMLARLVLDKGNFTPDWKEDSEGTLERWGSFQTLSSELVRELFVQYTGPFVVRAGRQNWDVAQKIVLEGPMDGIRLQYPVGQLPWGRTTLSAGYMAVSGGWNSYNNFNATGGRLGGNRQEIFGASNKLDAWYADLDIRAAKGLRFQPYLLKVVDRGAAGDADLNLDKDFNAATMPRDGHFRPLWTGIAASTDFAPWKFDAEAVLLTGDYTANRKLRANALQVKAARDFGKVASLGNVSSGLQFGRGSGNGTGTTGAMRDFSALFMCRERNKFGKIFSEDIRAGYYFNDSNLANITYLRLESKFEPRQGLKLTPSVTRIWTTSEVFAGRGPVSDWSQGTATSTQKTRDVGWEMDLDVAFPIYKRLDGFFSLGYFRPGAVYARPDGSKPKAALEAVLGGEFKF